MFGNIIAWIIVGTLVGWIASTFINSDRASSGGYITGIIGAIVAGAIYAALDNTNTGFNFWSVLVSIIGAFLIIYLVNLVVGSRRS